jgi:hypothetical protein
MEEAEQLLTLTQVAIAIAGFAGIIGTFQFKDGERIRRGDAVGLGLIVNTGLMAAFYSTMPMMLSNFGMSDEVVWAVASGSGTVIYIIFMYYAALRLRRFKIYKTMNKILVFSLFCVAFLIIVINWMNAFNIVFEREFGPFYISLIYALGSVCYMFSRLLLRPIWRTIRKQESENL